MPAISKGIRKWISMDLQLFSKAWKVKMRFTIYGSCLYIGEKKQRFIGWESEVRYMRICEKLITSIQDEHYSHEYFDYYDNTFSFEKIEDSDNFEMKSEVTRDDLQSYINKYPNTKRFVMNHPKYSKFTNSMSEVTDSRLAMVMGIARHEKAKKLLFKILEQKIENWWD